MQFFIISLPVHPSRFSHQRFLSVENAFASFRQCTNGPLESSSRTSGQPHRAELHLELPIKFERTSRLTYQPFADDIEPSEASERARASNALYRQHLCALYNQLNSPRSPRVHWHTHTHTASEPSVPLKNRETPTAHYLDTQPTLLPGATRCNDS